jgi:hypothetical protein
MTKSSKLSRSTSSAEAKELIKNLASKVFQFRREAEEILSEFQIPIVIEDANKAVETLLSRFHLVVREIHERHEDRPTLKIDDEYDVQDLLHGLLTIYFDDVRTEQWTPELAGYSTRIDFLLKKERIAIEAKKTRKGLGKKELGNQLLIDIAHYQKHPDCNTLYCFIYDPEERMSNPTGFENDLTGKQGKLSVKVLVVPKRI